MNTPAVSPPSHGNGEPSQWVRHWAHLVAAGGAVLDVASGAGRHARFFASRGHPVTAIDRDAVALDTMRDEPLITTFAADLEGAAWPLSDDAKFAAVVVTNYLHRPLFPQLLNLLAPGGVLVYETFAQGNESIGKPSNPAFLLAPGELLDVVRGRLRVVAFQDGFLAQPRPAYVQRICAILEAERSVDTAQAAPPPCYELAG
ncbi:class I SAM-dependent methyltransferase [Paraburkholderia terricola]|jgi:SAM-dependent methyltransferase|uniref:Methyltransferase domain-containing protein n=1 Tax=Paraburkholderia terricola TaxID=169427 RepID=A0A1M6KVL7_9BURK|nr:MULTISPECIES: class I SAM-dependent methyltransferase [Paraburkholderia]ORC49000.1 SAM-dependent methyltransferase [Burkholderia sp. A27]MDR6408564.1 SAM-dependent methyltransferase [Paraburkholderia terricola]MDR6482945.1 SAM-dependent methyltransferase [Paraburkholderia terricola]SDN79413.1 Methyltransferase domain-containing protein [Paraburkholderia sediminicola]SHJ63021.1 Methyltransferase domain-containing protein [Paraburkholderia terricola]